MKNNIMENMDFTWFTEPLADKLTGNNVLIACVALSIVMLILYFKWNRPRVLLNCLPGLFTSIGLLGTFVAICHSLGNINVEDIDILDIIEKLVPAFTSSIAGLVSAFLATFFTKILYGYEDNKVDERMHKESPEVCLYDISQKMSLLIDKVNKISNQQSEQANNSKIYNERLNTSIGKQSEILEKFINDFVKRMDDIFKRMHGQIEQNIKDFGEEQFKKCADTLEGLTAKLTELSASLLEDQKLSVKKMIDGTHIEMQYVTTKVAENLEGLSQQISKSLNSLQTLQNDQYTEIFNTYNALTERLASQNTQFTESVNARYEKQLAQVTQQSVDNLQQMIDLKSAFTEVNETMLRDTSTMNKEITDTIRTEFQTLVADLQTKINDQVAMASRAIEANVQSLEKSYSFISEHVANLKGNYESAAHAYEDAVNNAHRMNESQEKILSTVEESMLQVAKTNEGVEQVIQIIDNRQERLEKLVAQINELDTTIELLQKLESQLNRIVTR